MRRAHTFTQAVTRSDYCSFRFNVMVRECYRMRCRNERDRSLNTFLDDSVFRCNTFTFQLRNFMSASFLRGNNCQNVKMSVIINIL